MHPTAFVPQYSLHSLHKTVTTKHHYAHDNRHHHRNVHALPSSASSPHAPQHIRVGSLGHAAHETRFTLARRGRLFEFEGHNHAMSTPVASCGGMPSAGAGAIPNTAQAIAAMLGRHRRKQVAEAVQKSESLAHDLPHAPPPPSSRDASKRPGVPLPESPSLFEPFRKMGQKVVADLASVAELYAPASGKKTPSNSSVSELYGPPAKAESRSSVSLLYAPPKTQTPATAEEKTVVPEIPSSVSDLYAPPIAPPPTQAATGSKPEPVPVTAEDRASVSFLYAPPPSQTGSEEDTGAPRAAHEAAVITTSQSSVSQLYAPPPKPEQPDAKHEIVPVTTEDRSSVSALYSPPDAKLAAVKVEPKEVPVTTEDRSSVSLLYSPPEAKDAAAEVGPQEVPVMAEDRSSVSVLYSPPEGKQTADDDKTAVTITSEDRASVSVLYAPPPSQPDSVDDVAVPSSQKKSSSTTSSQSSVSLLYAPPPESTQVATKDEEDASRALQTAFETQTADTVDQSPAPTVEVSTVEDFSGASAAVSELYSPPQESEESFIGKAFEDVKDKVVEGIDAVKRLVSGTTEGEATSGDQSTAVTRIEEQVEKLVISDTAPVEPVAEKMMKKPSQADIINTTVAQLYQPPPSAPTSVGSANSENNTSVSVLYQPPSSK